MSLLKNIYCIEDLQIHFVLLNKNVATIKTRDFKYDHNFQILADKIVEELYSYITSSDIKALLDYWQYLDLRYFSRLDARFFESVKKFEISLLRYYLVYATQQKRKDKIFEFFETFGSELSGNPEWSKWFGFPFSKNPASDPNFELFFTKQWHDLLTVSLHNFLNTIFQNMSLPSLLCFNLDRQHRKALESEIDSLRNEIDNLKTELVNGDTEIISLKQKVAQAGNTRRRRNSNNMHDKIGKDLNHHDMSRSSLATSGMSLSSSISRSTTPSIKHETGSDHNDTKSPEIFADDRSMTPISEYDDCSHENINPFIINSQEIFLENTSGVTVAKISRHGNLVASCDVDNIIRIWSYSGSSSSTLKLSNHDSNILSLEWESRSDKLLLYGTDERLVKVYNKEAKSIIYEYKLDDRFPRINQLCCSPAESLFACSGSLRSMDDTINNSDNGSLYILNLKTMTIQDRFKPITSNSSSSSPLMPIETIKFNHNGQMLVTGDKSGYIRIFDIRTLKPIMEWDISNSSKNGNGVICSQFSFDETSVYIIDESGELSQWSCRKPGSVMSQLQLQGFPPTMPTIPTMNITPKLSRKRTPSTSSIRSTRSTRSTSSIPAIIESTPYVPTSRVSMVAFSDDTEHLVCSGGTHGVIYQSTSGEQVQTLAPHKQHLTAVDWSENNILTAAMDGTVRISRLVNP